MQRFSREPLEGGRNVSSRLGVRSRSTEARASSTSSSFQMLMVMERGNLSYLFFPLFILLCLSSLLSVFYMSVLYLYFYVSLRLD